MVTMAIGRGNKPCGRGLVGARSVGDRPLVGPPKTVRNPMITTVPGMLVVTVLEIALIPVKSLFPSYPYPNLMMLSTQTIFKC